MSDLIRLEIDEHGPAGANGYGFTIEQTPDEEPQSPPLVGHLLVTILRTSSAQVHPPTNLILARKVLTWLARYRFPAGTDFSFFDPMLLTTVLAERTPPGFGSPGTRDWLWYGIQAKRVECPPLRGRCTLTLCQAMPKWEDWDPHKYRVFEEKGEKNSKTSGSAMMTRLQYISSRRLSMSCPQRLSTWHQEVSSAFAHLSKPQALGLALWSAGIALTGSGGISQISALLALVFQQKEGTVFQRLREWYLDAAHKWGGPRRDLDVTMCFGPLLRWILGRFGGGDKRLALALDATSLGDRWTVLAVCVLVRGCAIPVAWKVLSAHAKGSWRPYWEGLLQALQGSIPDGWLVLVLADRGLYARWLYTAILAWGWHPFLRINLGVKAREPGEASFDWLSRWVPQPGMSWKGSIECFAQQKSRLCCTLLVQWAEGYKHPWAVLTDLDASEANSAWYSLRAWVEIV